ncbi:amidohydrolase family protein [Microbulbifer sp. ANSA005]|uniref:amidohydrolase family protein n=1 Tax=Microbulbifer sp. ANSA005 TaxID=3243362 RepID=UPI0040423877
MEQQKQRLFDSHFHIINPKFPLFPNHGYLPPTFTVDDYQLKLQNYQLVGGAVVSGSFQKLDQTYLIDALEKLGKSYVGVTQLSANTPDTTILSLHKHGVRALRFNLVRGGSEQIDFIDTLARRVFDLAGWHVELYVESSALTPLYNKLIALPAASIDHMGITKQGFPILLKLAEKGVKVKASGFGRLDFDPAAAIVDLYQANPHCLMFGSDLPSTRAPRPFKPEDILLIRDTLDEAQAENVLVKNAYQFYLKK